jgi:hypothetical protein
VAKASDPRAGSKDADKAGLLSGLLAEENEFDRRSLWRIGSWGFAAVGAVVLAVAANQSSMGWRRDQLAAADLTRQAQQIQLLTKESQNETRRLASAIDTLNGDRDRLFARVTVVEQGLDSVTGAINKQSTAANSASVASAPPKPMPPASAMPSMIMVPQVVAADNAGPSVPLPQSQAAPATNARAITPEKPKETKTETKTEQAKAEPAKPEQAKPAAADAASLPQIASNKPTAPAPTANPPTQPPAVVAQTSPPAMAAGKSMMGPPDPAAPRLIETSKEPAKEPSKTAASAVPAPPAPAPDGNAAAAPPKDDDKPELDADAANDADKSTIQRTEFAVELGSANSIGGLRALWRGLLKSRDNKTALGDLQPIIVLRESNTGLGMQLKLAAGPLHDAAEAARICAALTESNKRTCETTVFDGQRLAMGNEETAQPSPAAKPQPGTEAGGKSTSYKRYRHSGKKEDPPAAPPPKESSTFSSLLGLGKR